ncbi:hypothetical protein [Brevibacillus sp. SAFN-007a]|uniref:hypothetical protein n=1 Tax=Brevibacillus sp. SAFN-007a TaxID=3436862 RepID=UPI003F7F14BB
MDVMQVLTAHGYGGGYRKGKDLPVAKTNIGRGVPRITFNKPLTVAGMWAMDVSGANFQLESSNEKLIKTNAQNVQVYSATQPEMDTLRSLIISPDGTKLYGGYYWNDAGSTSENVYEFDAATGVRGNKVAGIAPGGSPNAMYPVAVDEQFNVYVYLNTTLRKYKRNADGTFTLVWTVTLGVAGLVVDEFWNEDKTVLMLLIVASSKATACYVDVNAGVLEKSNAFTETVPGPPVMGADKSVYISDGSVLKKYDYNKTVIWQLTIPYTRAIYSEGGLLVYDGTTNQIARVTDGGVVEWKMVSPLKAANVTRITNSIGSDIAGVWSIDNNVNIAGFVHSVIKIV